MTLPWLIGQLFEPLGPGATMIVIFTALAIGVGVFALLMLRQPKPIRSAGVESPAPH
jgi:hypothetical protein